MSADCKALRSPIVADQKGKRRVQHAITGRGLGRSPGGRARCDARGCEGRLPLGDESGARSADLAPFADPRVLCVEMTQAITAVAADLQLGVVE